MPFLSTEPGIPRTSPAPDFSRVKIVDAAPGSMVKLSPMRFRNHSRFVFYADRARRVNFTWKQRPFGRIPRTVEGNVEFFDADGNTVASAPLPGKDAEPLAFAAPRAGFYFLDANHSRLQLTLLACDAPIAADVSKDWANVIDSTGELYFFVPENAPSFGFFAAGDGGEAIGMEIVSPSGRSVCRRPSVFSWHGHVEPAGAEPGLWKAVFRRAEKGSFEDWLFYVTGIVGHVFLSSEKYWILRRR